MKLTCNYIRYSPVLNICTFSQSDIRRSKTNRNVTPRTFTRPWPDRIPSVESSLSRSLASKEKAVSHVTHFLFSLEHRNGISHTTRFRHNIIYSCTFYEIGFPFSESVPRKYSREHSRE